MFQRVIIMLEGAAGVVGRIDIDALHLACVVGKQGSQGLKVVALNEQIARIRIAH